MQTSSNTPSLRLLALPGLSAGLVLLIGAWLASGIWFGIPAGGAHCSGKARSMTRLELLFGMNRPDGRMIAEDEWMAFLDAHVTPRFPSGFTVLGGPGQWRAFDGHVERENAKLLVIWHANGARSEADIESIREAYKRRFQQDSVMRVDSTSCVSF